MNHAQLLESLTIRAEVPCALSPEPDIWSEDDLAPLAKTICHVCPVREACAEWGAGEEFGVWGGLSSRDRNGTGIQHDLWQVGVSPWELARAVNEFGSGMVADAYGIVQQTLAQFLRRSGFEYTRPRLTRKPIRKGGWGEGSWLARQPLGWEARYTTSEVA